MTLITTIINSNIRCIAGDTISNYCDGSHGIQRKVYLLKDGIVSIFEILQPDIIEIFENEGLNLAHDELLTKLYNVQKIVEAYKNEPGNKQYTGIFILSKENAYLDFFPLGLRYDLISKCKITSNQNNQTYGNSQMDEIINRSIILNIPLKDLGGIPMPLYRSMLTKLEETLIKEFGINGFESINDKNFCSVLKKYYSSVYSDIALNKGKIGGDIDICYTRNNKDFYYRRLKMDFCVSRSAIP